MKHEFTIKKLNGRTIELYTEDYRGNSNWIGEVWEDGSCIHSCLSPEGIDALRECERFADELAEVTDTFFDLAI